MNFQKVIDYLKLNLPFSYMWLLRTSIENPSTILDLGCGDGSLMELLSRGRKWQITGIDIFKKSIGIARKRKVYYRLIQGDLLKKISKEKLKTKYDVVFFSQVIEHLTKEEGLKVLNEIEKLAKKRIVIGIPRGFMEQPHEFLDDNPYQVHKSGWNIEDFTSRKYKVYGVGFLPIWSHHGLGRNDGLFRKIVANVFSYLMSPLVYFFPVLGSGIMAIKDKGKS